MPSIPLHILPSSHQPNQPLPLTSLPHLLSTPTGLALLEIQGTLHSPNPATPSEPDPTTTPTTISTPIGRLVFPLYNPTNSPDSDWMKRVYLYVGKHQRLTGEVKQLAKPIAVIQKRANVATVKDDDDADRPIDNDDESESDLEITEIVRYKILFASRPEPVGE